MSSSSTTTIIWFRRTAICVCSATIPVVSTSAAKKADGTVVVSLANVSLDKAQEVVFSLESLKADHEKVITLEDGALEGGFGEKIARFYGDSDMRTLCFGIKKGLYDRYDYQQLAKDNELTPEQIVARV